MRNYQIIELAENLEAEGHVELYDKLFESILNIDKKVAEISGKYNIKMHEVYMQIGFSLKSYYSNMLEIISSAYCKKITDIGYAGRYTAIMEGTASLMECVSVLQEAEPKDAQIIVNEIDSTKDTVMHDLESLEQQQLDLRRFSERTGATENTKL